MTAKTVAAMKAMRVVCAVLLLSLGWGHLPVRAVAPASSVVAAHAADYRLPDGSFAELCTAIGHRSGHQTLLAFCDLCLLSAMMALPQPASGTWLKTEFAWLANPIDSPSGFSGHGRPRLPRSRGPPMPV